MYLDRFNEGTQILNLLKMRANQVKILVLILNKHFLNENENQLLMKIKENGKVFDYKEKKIYGLTNLQNRIKKLNGTFKMKFNQNGTVQLNSIPISK